jgi:toluene monooxygenase system ferredoxin subunit
VDDGWRRLEDGDPILIFFTGREARGVQSTCPHAERSLEWATLSHDGSVLRCPFHGWTFRLSDGIGVNCPYERIAVYEIKDEDGVRYARRVAQS